MLREADLVVMPSRTEGFGLLAPEAISAGVPVLVSSETGIAKALQDLENGMSVVVKTDVSDEWANRIFRLSEQTRRDRHITALRLREQYKLKYSWEKECKKFEKMILELVKITDQNEIPLNPRLTGMHFFLMLFLHSLPQNASILRNLLPTGKSVNRLGCNFK